MVYDAARRVVTLFGGFHVDCPNCGAKSNQTWLWNGAVWARSPAPGPLQRSGHAMSFDMTRGVAVLFGGELYICTPNCWPAWDTWEWNGDEWALRSETGPDARLAHAMAYFPPLGVTILFGGGTNQGLFPQTWAWDGQSWSILATSGPPVRYGHSLAYDPDRAAIVLFGGADLSGRHFNDLWEWDGLSWQEVAAVNPPAARVGAGLTYDTRRGVFVLFGGQMPSGSMVNETWELVAPGACYPDCDSSTTPGRLDIFDFLCFQNRYAAGAAYACACDTTTGLGVCDIFDFLCFQSAFAAGCP